MRKLVEQDQVLALFNTLGTPTNTAIQGYLNDNKVPQLFVATGADKWNDPKHYPWTMGWQPSYRSRRASTPAIFSRTCPNAKIAVLYQNDDFGKDYLIGLREGLGDKADKMIVATQTYETTDATVDSQIVALQGSGADVMLTVAIPKFAAQAIRKDLRHRLEADPLPQQRVDLGRSGDAARGTRERQLASSRPATAKSRPIRNGRTRPNTRNGWPG